MSGLIWLDSLEWSFFCYFLDAIQLMVSILRCLWNDLLETYPRAEVTKRRIVDLGGFGTTPCTKTFSMHFLIIRLQYNIVVPQNCIHIISVLACYLYNIVTRISHHPSPWLQCLRDHVEYSACLEFIISSTTVRQQFVILSRYTCRFETRRTLVSKNIVVIAFVLRTLVSKYYVVIAFV